MPDQLTRQAVAQVIQGAHLHPRVERVLRELFKVDKAQVFPVILDAAAGARSGPGAVPVNTSFVNVTTTGVNDALTLADGTILGQQITIQHTTDGGDFILTPANFADGTTLASAAAGDFAVLMWTGSDWQMLVNSGMTLA